jgi:hypothetical protein
LKISSNYNLGKLHPKLVSQWHPTKNGELTPFVVTPGSHDKVWWICELGHEWKTVVKDRVRGSGCPKCFNEKRGEIIRLAALKRSET